MTREATILRETAETRIEVTVNLDGAGRADVACGIGFFDTCYALLRVTAVSI